MIPILHSNSVRRFTMAALLLMASIFVHAQQPTQAENALLIQARADINAGDFQRAIDAMLDAIHTNPHQALFWYSLGRAQLRAGRFESAIASLGEAIKLLKIAKSAPPENIGNGYNELALAQYKVGKLDDAIASFETAKRLDPASANVYATNETNIARTAASSLRSTSVVHPPASQTNESASSRTDASHTAVRRSTPASLQTQTDFTGSIWACTEHNVAPPNAFRPQEQVSEQTHQIIFDPSGYEHDVDSDVPGPWQQSGTSVSWKCNHCDPELNYQASISSDSLSGELHGKSGNNILDGTIVCSLVSGGHFSGITATGVGVATAARTLNEWNPQVNLLSISKDALRPDESATVSFTIYDGGTNTHRMNWIVVCDGTITNASGGIVEGSSARGTNAPSGSHIQVSFINNRGGASLSNSRSGCTVRAAKYSETGEQHFYGDDKEIAYTQLPGTARRSSK